ncbi:nucleic acid-binding protein [Hypoxylon fuscum]|nr:nucleic acid-binding protein [Hypoxylon fuscum]
MSFLARRATAAAPSLARAFSASARRDIAKITLVGNLAATPELKATSTGRDIIEYAVASNSGPRDNRQTSWFRVAAFVEEGPRRDFLTSLPKGATVYVEGDAQMNSYTDAEGKPRSALSIYQKNIEVLRRPTPAE